VFPIVVDCTSASSMTRFRATALGYELEPQPEGLPPGRPLAQHPCARGRARPGPPIWLQQVPELRTGAVRGRASSAEGVDLHAVAIQSTEDDEFDVR
jgi:hypothetical protein